MRIRALTGLLAALFAALTGCAGGADVDASSSGAPSGCTGSCATASSNLTVADVQTILAQAIAEAQARSVLATIAVVDRVGNVLAVYRMGNPAAHVVTVSSSLGNGTPAIFGGLEGASLPTAALPNANIDHAAAISKAITGAYLSSEGNAFSTRTANQIVQSHFNPGVSEQPSGPLFGVQFSQLPCSDFSRRYATGLSAGPHRSPLGLAADPGGFPLYKGGTVVGGVGVLADGVYGVNADINNQNFDLDEAIAIAGTAGYEAPANRRADQIAVNGLTLRYTNTEISGLASAPAGAPAFGSLSAATGVLIPVPGYTDGTLRAGAAFGQLASGIMHDGNLNFPGQDAFVFVDDAGTLRYPPIDALDTATLGTAALTAGEVLTVLRSALDVANRARAQIRQPLSTPARVTISVVDTQGNILGMVRGRDAPVFGSDVSVQKGRTAALFSSASAAAYLGSLPDAKYVDTAAVDIVQKIALSSYVSAVRAFVGRPTLLADGEIAFTDRANGNLSRPFFPDGIDGSNPGPFSKPAGQWSPFSTGLQLDMSINAILQHVFYVANVTTAELPPGCAGVDLGLPPPAVAQTDLTLRSANGIQIFPGSVPIYRNGTLIGGVGVSGDGVDQDDMVAFLGLNNAGVTLGGTIGNAPAAVRADTLTPQGTRLRYVECPQSPFIGGTANNVCDGL
jgi:uncharacterized protein GlcG (DUF336 family)